jgi:hypothetical protein
MAPTSFSTDALIVRGTVARQQSDEEVAKAGATSPATQPGGETASPEVSPQEPPTVAKPKRFFGSVELDPARPIRAFESIFNAIIAILQSGSGSKVRLTLEIEAEAPDGFSDADIRDVRDNAKQLKFRSESTGFE